MFKTLTATFLLFLNAALWAQDNPAPEQPALDDTPKPEASIKAAPAPIEIKRMPRLTVNVTGLAPEVGKVEVSLFDSAENFMKKPFYQESGAPDAQGNLQVRFLNVTEGIYGLVVVHDVNGNEVYDTGILGFGAEPVGYSNGTSTWLGRPEFDAVSFEVQQDLEVSINMN